MTLVQRFLGTNAEATPEQERDLREEDVERCTSCGYWSFNFDFDEDGRCEQCQDIEE